LALTITPKDINCNNSNGIATITLKVTLIDHIDMQTFWEIALKIDAERL